MSKFTKALNKIQKKRRVDEVIPKAPEEITGLHIPAEIPEHRPAWDRGIRQLKNVTPEHEIVTHHFPNSLVSEQYRMLRTSLKPRLDAEAAQVIMISSSIHSEGKSVTATNLAISLAEDPEVKVALIDADLRKGRLAEYLGFGKSHPGVTELIEQNLNPKEVFLKNSRPNLAVMPRGAVPKNPSSVIGSHKFRILLAELRPHFDYIIVDAPPIMSVADAGIMARETDGIVFVIQIGRTPKSVIAHANHLFKQAGAKMLGYVLTNVEFQTSDYRYYNSYYEAYAEGGPKGVKQRWGHGMKRAGFGLENMEEKFNSWWGKKVLKNGSNSEVKEEAAGDQKETIHTT